MKKQRTWMFHKEHGHKLFTLSSAEEGELMKEGWSDSPAKLGDESTDVNDDLLIRFKDDPKSLNKEDYFKIADNLKLKIIKAWKEETLIAKIQEHLDGHNQDTD